MENSYLFNFNIDRLRDAISVTGTEDTALPINTNNRRIYMLVTDAGQRIFTCDKGEAGKIAMKSDGTAFGINFAFDPPVPNTFTQDGNVGVIEFDVVKDTDLIINFNYSENSGGKYACALTTIEEDADGIFPETVRQFGVLPQRRTYTFLADE